MPLVKLLGEKLLAAGGKTVATKEALHGASAVGLYFSASWCPPCRGFTPQLIESYEKFLYPKGFRCVLISGDRDAASFNEYFAKMPWLALPYEDRQRQAELSAMMEVQTIPTLALVDQQGRTITTEARNTVVEDPEGKNYPWPAPLVRDLALGNPGSLNKVPSVVVICDSADATAQAKVFSDLEGLAGSWTAAKSAAGAYGYFTSTGGELTERLRELCKLPNDGVPRLLLLDIPDNGGFYKGAEGAAALELNSVKELLQAYEAGSLKRQQLEAP
eukprot:TRINITY_DN33277_c0_g1_i1.p1 TRINITY_DN33277_c0_g1~~TRINITY_DN33277_c0_g1_i1.p1  ORF type:complete len:274 (-),score=64.17 TRINITY_DN33277_c0_g1_i1:37-858(-)